MGRLCFPAAVNPLIGVVLVLLLFGAQGEGPAFAQASPEEIRSETYQVDRLVSVRDYDEAIGRGAAAYNAAIEALPEDHPVVIAAATSLGRAYLAAGQSADAEPLFLIVAERLSRSLGEADLQSIQAEWEVVALYRGLNRYEDAIPRMERILEILSREYVPNFFATTTARNDIGHLYMLASRFAEAEPLLDRALVDSRRYQGEDSPAAITIANNRAELHFHLEEFAEAESLLLETQATLQETQDGISFQTLTTTRMLADLYERIGCAREAVSLRSYTSLGALAHNNLPRARQLAMESVQLAEQEFEADDLSRLEADFALASYQLAVGEADEAAAIFGEISQAREEQLGPNNAATLAATTNFGASLAALGRYYEAIRIYQDVLDIQLAVLGENAEPTISTMSALANTHRSLSSFARARPLADRAYSLAQANLSITSNTRMAVEHDRAMLLLAMNEADEAEEILIQLLERRGALYGRFHPSTIRTRFDFATLLGMTGRSLTAQIEFSVARQDVERGGHEMLPMFIPLQIDSVAPLLQWANFEQAREQTEDALERSISIFGASHPITLNARSNLALILLLSGDVDGAANLFNFTLQLISNSLGEDSQLWLSTASNYTFLLAESERTAEALTLQGQVVDTSLSVLGSEHSDTLAAVRNYFTYRAGEQTNTDPSSAALSVLRSRLGELPTLFDGRRAAADMLHDPISSAGQGQTTLEALHAAMRAGDVSTSDPETMDFAFRLAQSYLYSEAADALGAKTSVLENENPSIRQFLESLNSATTELDVADGAYAYIRNIPYAERDREEERDARRRVEEARSALSAASRALENANINVSDLTGAQVVSITDAQQALQENEALVLYYEASRDGLLELCGLTGCVQFSEIGSAFFAFVITEETARVVPLDVSQYDIDYLVSRLRRGLLIEADDDYGISEADLLDQEFDLRAARNLYRRIFEPLEEHLAGVTHIQVVTDGLLQTLPMHVLVKALPPSDVRGFAQYRQAVWLGDQYSFARLPSVASLIALRRQQEVRPGRTYRFLGIGDPQLSSSNERNRSSASDAIFQFANASGVTSVNDIPELPETAALLSSVQRIFGEEASRVILGPDANEERVFELSQTGELGQFQSIVFATHALINDEVQGLNEPAIVLSPSDPSRSTQDGLLRASEVIQLRMQADFVILAACNTAAADGSPGAEALSGLAKAFYYAGARALLVSNWPAEAGATAELIPELFEGTETEGLSRSESLQRAMIALRDDHPFDFYAHPALWAPFMVVGDE